MPHAIGGMAEADDPVAHAAAFVRSHLQIRAPTVDTLEDLGRPELMPTAWEVLVGPERMPIVRPFETEGGAQEFASTLDVISGSEVRTEIRTLYAIREHREGETRCAHCHEAMDYGEKRACPEQDDPGWPCVPEERVR